MDGGDLIKEARRRAGITQQELGVRMGTTQSVIARWESGRRSPTFLTTERAIRECGLALRPRLVPRDEGPLSVARSMESLTSAEKLEANRRLVALSGIASEGRAT